MKLLDRFEATSLRNKILIPMVIATVALLTIQDVFLGRFIGAALTDSMTSKIDSIGKFIAKSSAPYVTNWDLTALDSFAKEATRDSDIVSIAFFDNEGKRIAGTGTPDPTSTKQEFEIKESAGTKVGKLFLEFNLKRVSAAIWKVNLAIVLIALFVQGALTVSVVILARRITRPLIEIKDSLGSTSSVLAGASGDLNHSSEQLNQAVTDQATGVQETIASMKEMSVVIRQSVDRSKSSSDMAGKVNEKAKGGLDTMGQMLGAMASMDQSRELLKNITTIMSQVAAKTEVIDDIVLKTQLLSFNASIEAARAGAHGKGFAVVAAEVGNLAKLSGTAAKEIDALLEDSAKQVQQIVSSIEATVTRARDVSQSAMAAFTEIANGIKSISAETEGISVSAREQELGISHCFTAMTRMEAAAANSKRIAAESVVRAETLNTQSFAVLGITNRINRIVLGDEAAKKGGSGAAPPAAGAVSGIAPVIPLASQQPHAAGQAPTAQPPSSGQVHGMEVFDANDPSFQRKAS